MSITIDVREHKLIQCLEGITTFTKAQLDLGDVVIKHNDTFNIVIERKTLADMAASLKDNRWREQKMRLKTARTNGTFSHIVYIIEGTLNFNENDVTFGLSNKAIVSMFLNCIFKDNIRVIQTKNVVDTSEVITALAKRIDTYASCDSNTLCSVDDHQEALIKSKKKENVTRDTVFVMQLCAIPGISHKKAMSLIEELNVSNISALLDKIGSDETVGIKVLSGVKGIGKVLAKGIYQSLRG